jgi:hypothetical protein
MEVNVFMSATGYQNWINNLKNPVEIISVIVFKDEIVVTFKRK